MQELAVGKQDTDPKAALACYGQLLRGDTGGMLLGVLWTAGRVSQVT